MIGNSLILVQKFVPMPIQWSNPCLLTGRCMGRKIAYHPSASSGRGEMTELRGIDDLLGCVNHVLVKTGNGVLSRANCRDSVKHRQSSLSETCPHENGDRLGKNISG